MSVSDPVSAVNKRSKVGLNELSTHMHVAASHGFSGSIADTASSCSTFQRGEF